MDYLRKTKSKILNVGKIISLYYPIKGYTFGVIIVKELLEISLEEILVESILKDQLV